MANRVIRGPTVTINDRVFPAPDMLAEISQLIDDPPDGSDQEWICQSALQIYADASTEHREAIDKMLIALTGFSLPNILLEVEADEELLAELGIQDEFAEDSG